MRLARHPGMNPIKGNTDRIRINNGGRSALSMKPNLMNNSSNLMAVQPFARTAYGHSLMEGKIRHHKINFNYSS